MRLAGLPTVYRERAEQLRECGAGTQAEALEWAAECAEDALRGAMEEEITLEEAEIESGYSRSHLQRLIRARLLPATGRGARARILRRHLPRKPGVASEDPALSLHSLQLARAVAESGANQ